MNDTIAALATPVGKSAIAVVRVSGPAALSVSRRVLPDWTGEIPVRRPVVSRAVDFRTKERIDQVIVTYFPSPHSYTGEDIIEFSTHGSPAVVGLILDNLLNAGARMAQPGEFTRRAFLAGKMDLTQAESVAMLIDSETQQERRAAIRMMDGGFGRQLGQIRDYLSQAMAGLELELDFPEEGETVSIEWIRSHIERCIEELADIYQKSCHQERLALGLRVVIAGRVNAGKSSLFNRLAGADRAIVTDEPGTTRDVLEFRTEMSGVLLVLVDTAGSREGASKAEKIGIEKADREIQTADIVVYLLDAQNPDVNSLEKIRKTVGIDRLLAVWNKMDLVPDHAPDLADNLKTYCSENRFFRTSAKSGTGIDRLVDRISGLIREQRSTSDSVLMLSARQKKDLPAVSGILSEGLKLLDGSAGAEIVAEYLRKAHRMLGELVGDRVPADILDRIFSEFCIGK